MIDSIRARKLLVRSFVDDGGKTKQPVMVNQAISSRATESRIPKPSFRREAVGILISRLWKTRVTVQSRCAIAKVKSGVKGVYGWRKYSGPFLQSGEGMRRL